MTKPNIIVRRWALSGFAVGVVLLIALFFNGFGMSTLEYLLRPLCLSNDMLLNVLPFHGDDGMVLKAFIFFPIFVIGQFTLLGTLIGLAVVWCQRLRRNNTQYDNPT
jgi:hypothetical protein